MYSIKADGTVVKTTYDSIGAIAKILNVHHTVINNHLCCFFKKVASQPTRELKGGGGSLALACFFKKAAFFKKGNYLFSSELDSLELEKLKEISSLRKYNNLKV